MGQFPFLKINIWKIVDRFLFDSCNPENCVPYLALSTTKGLPGKQLTFVSLHAQIQTAQYLLKFSINTTQPGISLWN